MLAAMLVAAGQLALTVAVEPTRLNMQTPPPTARVRVVSTSGRTPRLWTPLGELSEPEALGGGRFEARYRAPAPAPAPASGAPAYTIVAAWDPESGDAGFAAIELWARSELPITTEPGARLTVQVGNHHETARADDTGRARVGVWVGPGSRRAKVIAEDAAGNTTVEEVALDAPRAIRLWLVTGSPSRVYAFSLGRSWPRLEADGAELDVLAQPGIARAEVRRRAGAREVTLTGDADGERVTLALSGDALPPRRFVDPRTELGGSLGPRISNTFTAVEAKFEWRRRVGGSRFHLGLDLGGAYAAGVVGDAGIQLGGAIVRAVGEARLSVAARVGLFLAAFAGASLVGERSSPALAPASTHVDGGPSLGGAIGVLVTLGPGLLTASIGGGWTPLVRLGLANLDGGMLSIGYRYGRL